MNYADLILPVPLQGLFTYAVPDGWSVQTGCRVLVSFGRSKKYVGLVARIHQQKPQDYEVKPILQVMDMQPIVTAQQLKLWQWIADYYLSPIGEVYKAALPAGLKAEDGYRPKTETYIRLTKPYRNETALHIALNMLTRSKSQLDAFCTFLELASPSDHSDPSDGTVTREELLNASQASATTINQLVKRNILETYEVEVGRLNHGGDYRPELIKPLTLQQENAYNEILMSMGKTPINWQL